MSDTLQSISSLIRSLVSLVVLGFVGVASWFGYQAYSGHAAIEAELKDKQAEVTKLTHDLESKQKQLDQLDLAMRLQKKDHRLAEIRVLDQWDDQETGHMMTKLAFVDLGENGQPLDRARVFTIEGDQVYVEALIVKYLDELVEKGDPMRGTAICLFKRLFGEYQEPSEGFVIDVAGSRPASYGHAGDMSDYEKEVWDRFWDYANDPDKSQKAGIRAAHGDAPFVKLRPKKVYLLELRSSGDLTIKAQDDERQHEKL